MTSLSDEVTERELIGRIAELERYKVSVAAEQARLTEMLYRMRSQSEARQGVPSRRRCQGLAGEVALARRVSAHRGSREVGFAKVLVQEMPPPWTC